MRFPGMGQQQPEKGEFLRQFSVDLTALARKGKLDPVIGRDEEIKRTIQILSRRTKSNPVLLGLPGVGKTAVLEGLATRIVNKEVPEVSESEWAAQMSLTSRVCRGRSYSRSTWPCCWLVRASGENLRTGSRGC